MAVENKSAGTIAETVKILEKKDTQAGKVNTILAQVIEQGKAVTNRMSRVKHKIAVMSGKGGVGKSSVTVNLANVFADKGYKVGILDVDLSGPCIPRMTGITTRQLEITPDGATPALSANGIKVASMELMLPSEASPTQWKGLWEDSAVWRGTVEMSVIREMISDVNWGELDYLFIDMPPASSDKPPILSQYIPDLAGAVIVTIPSEVSQLIVKKSIIFLNRELKIPIIGLIENMSGAVCPHCDHALELFKGSGETVGLLKDLELPLLGRVPFDSRIGTSSDRGESFIGKHPHTPAAQAFQSIAGILEKHIGAQNGSKDPS